MVFSKNLRYFRRNFMNKYLRAAVLTAFGASAFSVQSADFSSTNYTRSGSTASCQSGDDSRRSDSLQAVGLTADQRLICFNENRPDEAINIGSISGLMFGDALVGIDFRVQDKKLYGVSKTGGIYVLDTQNASALKVSQLPVALVGESFGVDFNPVADRLRIVSDTGQNLRHDVNSGGITAVDDPLDYPPATPTNAVGATAIGVTGSAYTNNDLDPTTSTTLYALETKLDQIALQSPPNDGTLAATGKLGSNAGPSVGFDIYSTVRNGVTVDVRGLASFMPENGASTLYSINLPTGKATSRGSFSSQNNVIGIAIPLNQL